MKMRDRTVLAVMVLVGFTTGEASARSTCRAKLQIGGAAAPGKGVMARCTDGTAACDSDGAADGGCTFSVSLCFDQGGASCSPDDVRQASIVPGAGFEGISAAMEALKGDAAPVCTAAADVRVATHGKRKGRAVLKMHTGKTIERLTFLCQPARNAGGSGGSATFATIQKKVFDATCATPTCHGAAAAAGGLNLAAGAAYGNLVGVAAANPAAAAAGALRVAPGDPDHSFLLRKLLGQIAPAEGSRMPLVGTPPSAANLDLIRRWIAAGAPETAPF